MESQMLETISEELSEAAGEADAPDAALGLAQADSFAEGQSSPGSSAWLGPSDHERCIQVTPLQATTDSSECAVGYPCCMG